MVLIAPPNTVTPAGYQVHMQMGLNPDFRCCQQTDSKVIRRTLSTVLLPLQIVFENRKLTADRQFYVPGVKEASWNKVYWLLCLLASSALLAPSTAVCTNTHFLQLCTGPMYYNVRNI
jgi:hypothetical protein